MHEEIKGEEKKENRKETHQNVKLEKNPCKKYYRQRAHCNPLSDSYLNYPLNTNYVDWELLYPQFLNNHNQFNCNGNKIEESNRQKENKDPQNTENNDNNNNNKTIYLNTNIHPMSYDKLICNKSILQQIEILDIGCGFGGLLFALSKPFKDKLILGMEIRDKVTNYVGEKIHTYRKNYYPYYNNIAIIRTNAIKFLPNYIRKKQIEKIFFCFPDPQFKRHNWRRRIITLENLSLYHYVLKKGGKLYFITDVLTVYLWTKNCCNKYPFFKMLSSEEYKDDICVKLMQETTEESQKVKKNNKNMYICVFQKI